MLNIQVHTRPRCTGSRPLIGPLFLDGLRRHSVVFRFDPFGGRHHFGDHSVRVKVTEEVVKKHLEESGKFIGFGSMRVENGGVAGRFSVVE